MEEHSNDSSSIGRRAMSFLEVRRAGLGGSYKNIVNPFRFSVAILLPPLTFRRGVGRAQQLLIL